VNIERQCPPAGDGPIFLAYIHNSHGEAEDEEGMDANSLAEARERAVTGIHSLLLPRQRTADKV
jgi:hypothetical protein